MHGFDRLFALADERRPRIPVAAAGAADSTVLAALARAEARGWVSPVLVGVETAIREAAARAGVDLAAMRVVDASEPAAEAVAEVRAGRAQLLMKGQIDTPALVRAMLNPDGGLRTGRTICQAVLMEITDRDRRFLLADTGITIDPTLEQKGDIVRSVIAAARALGVAEPRVAIVSASEKATPAMPDTIDAAELQRRGEQGEFGNASVEGPLSFDLAFAADAAAKKHAGGSVPGAADALVFPGLVAANLTVKAIMYTAQCRFGGMLLGAACPVVFMSRADTVETRLRSLALALAVAEIPRS